MKKSEENEKKCCSEKIHTPRESNIHNAVKEHFSSKNIHASTVVIVLHQPVLKLLNNIVIQEVVLEANLITAQKEGHTYLKGIKTIKTFDYEKLLLLK